MRPLVPSSRALAAVALCGAVAIGASRFHEDGGAARRETVGTHPRGTTPGFYGGSVPLGLINGSGAVASPTTYPPRYLAAPVQVHPGLEDYHEYYFTRGIYTDFRGGGLRNWGRRGWGGSWAIDYPKADQQFMVMVDHLLNIDLYEYSNAIRLDDPEVRRFPFLYVLEVGRMQLTEAEVHGLRDYLAAGGFLVVDDFWGSWEWANFEQEISRVLPGRPIVELGLDHPIFHAFYEIEEILQVPNRDNGIRGGPTYEQDGYVPHVMGIFDDQERLMVVINWNTDLGDAWEWAENPYYPLKYSRYAAEMGVNMIVYGMSH